MPGARLRPVFIEPSGRRWRAVRLLAAATLMGLAALVVMDLSPVARMIRTSAPGPDPQRVARQLGRSPAVVGSGPMIRIVAVRDGLVNDPFTGAALGGLTDGEVQEVRGRPLAVQRYGENIGSRQLMLTFDDGPDPRWTPRLLDVLARHHARATFFVTGRAAATHPELIRRIVREGHALGNHSLTHRNLSEAPDWRAKLELSGTEHLLERLAGQRVTAVRPPYDGGVEGGVAEEELAIARAQQLGFAVASYDFDTHDWAYGGGGSGDSAALVHPLPAQIPLPPLDGRDVTVLMHDSGGDRHRTVDYLDSTLLPAAAAAGYTVRTVPQAHPDAAGTSGAPVRGDTAADRAVERLATAWLVAPDRFADWLFVLAVFTLGSTGIGYALLALIRRWRRPPPRRRDPEDGRPAADVSVLIAAYNEEAVIGATLRSLVASRYPVREFVVVDDGSDDRTAALVAELARTLDPRIRLIRQPNARKAAALNTGLAAIGSDVVVTVDADTHAGPDMVGDLVRHFEADPYGTLGAVAGVVRVGNRHVNVLTRWQSLEYLAQIGVERAAHDLLGGIMIVPGACAAWRREAVLRAGGFSHDTLAEDCDLTLALHRMGWRVTQDDAAHADTEAPEDVDALLKQRVRWTYGNLQAIAKHRDMVLRPRFGWLGTVLLPWAVVSVVLPLLTIPFMAALTVLAFLSQGPGFLGGYYLAFTALQGLTAAVAVVLLREPLSQLTVVPLYRAVFDPLRSYLLYMSCYLAMRGVPVGWNKLTRTGRLNGPAAGARATP